MIVQHRSRKATEICVRLAGKLGVPCSEDHLCLILILSHFLSALSVIPGDPPNFLRPIVGLPVPHHHLAGDDHPDPMSPQQQQQQRSFSSSAFAFAAAVSPVAGSMKVQAPAGGRPPMAPSTDKGSDVQRVNIGVFGVMNAGKSTLINRITRQETSIVDATPGTTADVKVGRRKERGKEGGGRRLEEG